MVERLRSRSDDRPRRWNEWSIAQLQVEGEQEVTSSACGNAHRMCCIRAELKESSEVLVSLWPRMLEESGGLH